MSDPTRAQVHNAVWRSIPPATPGEIDRVVGAVMALLAETTTEVERLTDALGAAGHGWKVAQQAADEAVAERRVEVDKLTKWLSDSDLGRERMRQRVAEANDRVRELEAQLAAIRPKVLWEGETRFLGSRDDPRPDASWFVGGFALPVPAGTRVAVVAAEAREVTHACPPEGAVTPCCGRTPFELPRTDRMTADPSLVTCGATQGART